MRVIQLAPTISYGDAVGNDIMALHELLMKMGYPAEMYAENIHKLLAGKVKHFSKFPKLDNEDIVIYHLSTGTDLNYKLAELDCRKIMIYHNVTPPKFFRGYDPVAVSLTEEGLKGMRFLADKVDYCLADSDFNKQNLIDAGYKCPIDVLPILIPFDDYLQTPAASVMSRYSDDRTNILYTGRIAPNKKVENVIAAFSMYKRYYDNRSRLLLVGSYNEKDSYYRKVKAYAESLSTPDIIFTGHIKFDEILGYFRSADFYLCMSEHEGFCVPLVEAMFFDIPIIAYDKCAVPWTLGGSGMLLETNDPLEVAGVIAHLKNDSGLRDTVLENQRIRLRDFQHEIIADKFMVYLNKFVSGEL